MLLLAAAAAAAQAQNCPRPPGVPIGARYSCPTHTQTQQVGEPTTQHPGGAAGRGWGPAQGGNNASVQCQLLDDGSCHCGPLGYTGRNRPCRPDAANPPVVTRQYRYTVKSYIAPIGDRLGPTPMKPGMVVRADVNFRLAAVTTDAGFSEDPQTEDRSEGLYRLYTHVGLIAACRGSRMVRHEVGTVQHAVGTEPSRPLANVIALYPDPMIVTQRAARELPGAAGVTFGWFGRARPHFLAEPFFTSVAGRGEAVYIWHDLNVTVRCGAQGPEVDYAATRLTGSGFPSHRLWINGQLVRTIPQGPFANLWRPDPTRPELIR